MTIPVTETLSTLIQNYGYGSFSKYILGVSSFRLGLKRSGYSLYLFYLFSIPSLMPSNFWTSRKVKEDFSSKLKYSDSFYSKREITQPLLFHSDRGIQYASIEFRRLIKKNTLITQSMSRKANCWDNPVAESFFKTLKVELAYHHNFKTTQEAKLAVFEYTRVWYNRKRLHSSLGYKTPKKWNWSFIKLKMWHRS